MELTRAVADRVGVHLFGSGDDDAAFSIDHADAGKAKRHARPTRALALVRDDAERRLLVRRLEELPSTQLG